MTYIRITKDCRKCNKRVHKFKFNKEVNAKDGLKSWCQPCMTKDARDNGYSAHAYKCKYYDADPASKMWLSAQARAFSNGCDFNITKSDISKVLPKDMVCKFLGITMSYSSIDDNESPSIDRIDCSKGYVKGNIQVISNKANRIKGTKSMEEFLEYLKNE